MKNKCTVLWVFLACLFLNSVLFAGISAHSPQPGYIYQWTGGFCPPGNDYVAISGGGGHFIAMKADGTIVAWGYDSRGQSSDCPTDDHYIAVVCGNYHTYALQDMPPYGDGKGRVVGWGYNRHGQLSNIPDGEDFVEISAGSYCGFARKEDGTALAYGMNYDLSPGVVGSGVTTFAGIAQLATHGYRRNFLKMDGSVLSWMVNGTVESQLAPPGPWLMTGACWYNHIGLRTDGTIAAWGSGGGSGLSVPAGSDYIFIVGGDGMGLAMKQDRSVVGWGGAPSPAGSDYGAIAMQHTECAGIRMGPGPDPGITGDMNSDDNIDEVDMRLFADQWLQQACGLCQGSDYNGDNKVDGRDFAAIAANWKKDPPKPTVYLYTGGKTLDEGHVCQEEKDKTEESRFIVYRSGAITSPLTVGFALSGSATVYSPGQLVDDYIVRDNTDTRLLAERQLQGTITIPAGKHCTPIKFKAVDDALVEGQEQIAIEVLTDPAYTIDSTYGSDFIELNDYMTASGATLCADGVTCDCDETAENKPSISVTVDNSSMYENGSGQPGKLTINTTGDTEAPFMVYYTVTGSATAGSDYTALSGSILIPAGSSSASITLTAINDTAVEGLETVIVSVKADATYTIGTPPQGTVNIMDDDWTGPVMSVATTDATAEEGGSMGQFTITSTQTVSAMTVGYTVSGTATAGSDYTALSGSVVVNGTSATITVTPLEDIMYEGDETVIVNLTTGAGYQIGLPAQATVTVKDNDPTPIITAGFESGKPSGWTNSGTVNYVTTDKYSGTKSAQIQSANSLRTNNGTASTVGYNTIHVKYARKVAAYTSGQSAYLEWTADASVGNPVWVVLETVPSTATTWTYVDLVCPAGANNNSKFGIRFRGGATSNNQYFYIDDVEVAGFPQ